MDDDEAKRRLVLYSLVRFGGVVIFLFGLAIIYGNFIRTGGWPQLGACVAIIGALGGLIAPHLLKRSWDRRDREGQ